jgi:hypothetical protein
MDIANRGLGYDTFYRATTLPALIAPRALHMGCASRRHDGCQTGDAATLHRCLGRLRPRDRGMEIEMEIWARVAVEWFLASGERTPERMDELLEHYASTYAGAVVDEHTRAEARKRAGLGVGA